MEDIKQSTVNSDQSTVNQTSLSTVHRSQNSFLITLLSILLLISVFIAGFFAYQTQKLVAELRIKNEELIIKTPTPTSTPFETSVATSSATPIMVACTMEAKLCPDGSYVSRSGPKCEFDPCPTP